MLWVILYSVNFCVSFVLNLVGYITISKKTKEKQKITEIKQSTRGANSDKFAMNKT